MFRLVGYSPHLDGVMAENGVEKNILFHMKTFIVRNISETEVHTMRNALTT